MSAPSPLVEQILSGGNRELQLLAASGTVPLPLEDLVSLQVALASGTDTEVARAAHESLAATDKGQVAELLAEQADEATLRYFALHAEDTSILEAVIRRRDVPRSILLEIAPRLAPLLQEMLVLRQDAILEEPGILEALEGNPQLSGYARRRIKEYREHLLPKDRSVAPEAADAETEDAAEPAVAADGAKKEIDASEMTEGQIRALPTPQRLKLARGANRQLRGILIRDANVQVALGVLSGNQLTDQEVEQVAKNRAIADEVLAEIARRREWIRKYPIRKALVKNPRTQLATAMRLVPQMSLQDLRELARDRNIPQAVRAQALRLYQARR